MLVDWKTIDLTEKPIPPNIDKIQEKIPVNSKTINVLVSENNHILLLKQFNNC